MLYYLTVLKVWSPKSFSLTQIKLLAGLAAFLQALGRIHFWRFPASKGHHIVCSSLCITPNSASVTTSLPLTFLFLFVRTLLWHWAHRSIQDTPAHCHWYHRSYKINFATKYIHQCWRLGRTSLGPLNLPTTLHWTAGELQRKRGPAEENGGPGVARRRRWGVLRGPEFLL